MKYGNKAVMCRGWLEARDTIINHLEENKMTIKELSNPGEAVKVYGLYNKKGKLMGIKKMRGYVCDFETACALAPVAIGRLFLYIESKPIRVQS